MWCVDLCQIESTKSFQANNKWLSYHNTWSIWSRDSIWQAFVIFPFYSFSFHIPLIIANKIRPLMFRPLFLPIMIPTILTKKYNPIYGLFKATGPTKSLHGWANNLLDIEVGEEIHNYVMTFSNARPFKEFVNLGASIGIIMCFKGVPASRISTISIHNIHDNAKSTSITLHHMSLHYRLTKK